MKITGYLILQIVGLITLIVIRTEIHSTLPTMEIRATVIDIVTLTRVDTESRSQYLFVNFTYNH